MSDELKARIKDMRELRGYCIALGEPWPDEYAQALAEAEASADAPAPSFAGLVDDYAETMQRWAGSIATGVVEA